MRQRDPKVFPVNRSKDRLDGLATHRPVTENFPTACLPLCSPVLVIDPDGRGKIVALTNAQAVADNKDGSEI